MVSRLCLLSSLCAVLSLAAGQAAADEAIANRAGCFECHSAEDKSKGPSFLDIAARYRSDPEARGGLIDVVKKGGRGQWSELTGGKPMPPFSPRMSDENIEKIVDWILSQ